MKKKKFDCVEMMHRAQAEQRKILKGMSLEEKLEYYRKITEQMRARQLTSQHAKASASKR